MQNSVVLVTSKVLKMVILNMMMLNMMGICCVNRANHTNLYLSHPKSPRLA